MSEQRLVFPAQFPDAFTPRLTIDVPHPKDVAGFEDEVAHVINPDYVESQWAARVALMHLLRPKTVNSLMDLSFTVMSEPLARLVHDQAKGSGVIFFTDNGEPAKKRRDYVKDIDRAHIDSIIGLTMHATAKSNNKPMGPVELDVWYFREAITKDNRDWATGVKRIATLPRYNEKLVEERHKASKKRGAHIRQGVAGKITTRSSGIDPRS